VHHVPQELPANLPQAIRRITLMLLLKVCCCPLRTPADTLVVSVRLDQLSSLEASLEGAAAYSQEPTPEELNLLAHAHGRKQRLAFFCGLACRPNGRSVAEGRCEP
jgi:hypothetical protein